MNYFKIHCKVIFNLNIISEVYYSNLINLQIYFRSLTCFFLFVVVNNFSIRNLTPILKYSTLSQDILTLVVAIRGVIF